MITKKILYRGEAAKNSHYYEDQADDYYHRDGNAAVWQGQGARLLGLSGEVDSARFQAMLAGRYGWGIEAGTTIRKDAKARSGLDLTISAPKSITLQALVGGDERVIAAHDTAVSETLVYIEKHLAQSRQSIKGVNHVQNTGNLVIAKFRHETARATDGAMPDPQLHTHAIIMNLTRREDGSWAGLHNDNIVKLRALQDTVYMAALARELTALGYEIRHEKTHIELAHITREQIMHFSKRTAIIENRLAQQGLKRNEASHAHRQVATLATRTAKNNQISRDALHAHWSQQAAEVGMSLQAEHHRAKDRSRQQSGKPAIDLQARQRIADAAVIWAIKHHTERETVMQHSALIATSLTHAEGLVSVEQVESAIARLRTQGKLIVRADRFISNTDPAHEALTRQTWARDYAKAQDISLAQALEAVNLSIRKGRLSPIERQYATKAALDHELRIVTMEEMGRGAVERIFKSDTLQGKLENTTLTPGQRAAIKLMLADKNQIVGIQGLAGTGKSYALQKTQELLAEQGYTMVALAPYGTQVADLRRDGIDAKTIASQLTATETQRLESRLGSKTVVVIDEAGVIPVRQMEQLLRKLQPSGARIVLLGDTGQTKAVEAGRAFALLQEQGMEVALMGDIQRQQNESLKRAVELAATGKAKESLSLIDQVIEIPDRIVELETGQQARNGLVRYQAIAKEYVALPSSDRAQTLIVTGTNASRKAINNLVHEYRGLAGKGYQHKLLTRHDTTRMQRRHAKYYSEGDIVQSERDYKNGMQRGELYEVVKRDLQKDRLIVKSMNNTDQKIEIIPKMMSALSVYHQHEAELSVGDTVRVTRNNAELDLANGDRYEVLRVNETSVTIGLDGRAITLPADQPLHVDHAYATTAHSAQGLTCDRVFYNAESTSRTTAQDTYYVSISRERHEVVVFTDNAQKLPDAVARVPYKGLAHDLVPVGSQVEGTDFDVSTWQRKVPSLEIT